MSRSHPEPQRDVLEIDWAFFGELCRALALHVSRSYDPELIVGIAKAGVIPAAIIASILERPFAAMVITRKSAGTEPKLLGEAALPVSGKRILLVDETCDSGDTLKVAMHSVKAGKPTEVRTAVSFMTGKWQPDFHAFATDKAIILPWDREVVRDGELVLRPRPQG